MIQETELSLFVPSPELLIRLASGDQPLGVRAGPPRIKVLRETFFDTQDGALRRRGMTCKLRQVEGEEPSVVVTVGEGPDLEGITSRSRLTARAIGMGVFETLRGDSEPAVQVQKIVEPRLLRPQLALDIQRLGRVYRGGLLLRPVLLLLFDRITVQMAGSSAVFHEIRIRRRRAGGPLIPDLGKRLRDENHLFPDGLNTLQRAYRILAMEGKTSDSDLSPYALTLALSVFREGQLGFRETNKGLVIPTFRGSGEDAARALSSDLTGSTKLPLLRLGTTEPREGRSMVELWAIPGQALSEHGVEDPKGIVWYSWYEILEKVGQEGLRDPALVSTLLLLTRRRLLGQLPWLPSFSAGDVPGATPDPAPDGAEEGLSPELQVLDDLFPVLRSVEDDASPLADRLRAASELSRDLRNLFIDRVTRAKGLILSADSEGYHGAPVQLVDLISIRVRGILDRLHQCFAKQLAPQLEAAGVHIRPWSGIQNADRRAILADFSDRYLPSMEVAEEWGPSFIPHMPPEGCAVGLLVRTQGPEPTRFFHVVLGPDTPSFMSVPGSATVLPLEEVVRGLVLGQHPELEKAESFLFRFTTGEALVRELAPQPEAPFGPKEDGLEAGEPVEEFLARSHTSPVTRPGVEPPGSPPASPEVSAGAEPLRPPPTLSQDPGGIGDANRETPPLDGKLEDPKTAGGDSHEDELTYVETRQSVVVRVTAHQRMPESYQAQLLRALERQVSLKDPLIGWSDLFPVTGPLDLSGLDRLLELEEEG